MTEHDRDYGDETNYYNDDEDDFYYDDQEYEWLDEYGWDDDESDDYEDSGGLLVPNRPYPRNPSFGAEKELEEELALV